MNEVNEEEFEMEYDGQSKFKMASTIEFDQDRKDNSSKPRFLMSKLNHLMKDTKSSAIRNAYNRIYSPSKPQIVQ